MKCIEITPPADIQTCIQLPSSKSICNRALIINALAGSTCRPENLSDCDDTRVMIEALTHMPETIDIMAAGTAMRFLTNLFVRNSRYTCTDWNRTDETTPYQDFSRCPEKSGCTD